MWLKYDTLTVIALSVSELLAVDMPVTQSESERQDRDFILFPFYTEQIYTICLQVQCSF